MASELADKAVIEQPPSSETTKVDEVVSIELPAPQGWTKKFIPKKGGTGTPRRNEIVFIAPTGEEIKNKRQLDQYLKIHPDDPSSSEFDWGTGDTPRRSARISSKSKATDTPESGSSRKRQKKSRSKKEETEGVESAEDEAAADRIEDDKTEDEKDVEMKDAEAARSNAEEEKAEEADVDADYSKTSVEYTEEKADEVKEQKEADGVGLSDGNQTQAGVNKLEEVLEQEITQAPEETKKEEQPEENKVETTLETLPSQGEEQPEKKKPEAVENPSDAEDTRDTKNATEEKPLENNEQPDKNKPETVEKPSDVELPGDTNNAIEEKPVENKKESGEEPTEALVQPEADVSVNTVKEIEGSKQGPEELENKVSLEEVGPDSNTAKENQDGAMHTENQPLNPDGAPQEPGAAQPISC